MISTFWLKFRLAIDLLLNLFDLVAKDEIKLKVLFNFFNTMHNGCMVFNTNFAGDFGCTKREFLLEKEHGDLAGGFNIGDTRFAAHFLNGNLIIFGDLFDDLFGGDGSELGRFIDRDGAVLD